MRSLAYAVLSRLKRSNKFRKIISVQQGILPFPLGLFRKLNALRYISTLFYPYGYAVFRTSYDRDKIGYWTSPSALYWHFLNEDKMNVETLEEILSHPIIGPKLRNSGTVLEMGAGLGKQLSWLCKRGANINRYIAVEPNSHALKQNRVPASTHLLCADTIDSFLDSNSDKIDLFFSFDGVFEYLNETSARRVFSELSKRGCKHIIITREGKQIGTGKHLDRGDGTMLYDFELLASEFLPDYRKEKIQGAYLIYQNPSE